ncbi:S-layer homology domain-containing protein [Paenibacillus lignilyticus]|uniref:S-layer homology domain-containing protein n=1 Tax=Paenibacillus lignilyticus TaxID=1172615 RepID=A0ABS5CKW8_9BACL|nr:S-layer homology domain-containing protein [Paenibacillus lignilyticus]MBP3966504.1 S-layer homology domain-containing protein [Paenibacillus lignilyticus]
MKRQSVLKWFSMVVTLGLIISCFPMLPAAAAGDSAAALTASYTYHGDRLEDANDGIVSYDDDPKSRWTSYESVNPQDWVQFEYAAATSKNTAGLYIFDDGGGIKAPSSYDVQYWNGTDWASIPNQTKSPAVPTGNELNLVTFDSVSSTKFRVLFTHSGSKSGVTEIVFADSNTEPVPGAEVSPLGNASASYTFRLDQVSHVNDGIVSYDATPANRWTSYESPNETDWVQTNFGASKRKDAVGIYLFSDGGGIKPPASYDVQYLNESDEWVSAANQVKTPAEPAGNALNLVTFTSVEAQKFRIVFTHSTAKTGVTEIQYVDSVTQSLPTEPSMGEATASYSNNGDDASFVNDGIVSLNDFPRNRWTAYGSPNSSDWVQTEYESALSKNMAGVYLHDDGGGVKSPASFDVQYLSGSEWASVPGQVRTPAEPAAGLNLVAFNTVIASKYRVVFTHQGDAKSGATEISYVDTNKEPVPTAPPVVEVEPAIEIISPAIGSTVSGNVTITFKAPEMKNVWARVWHQPDEAHPDPNGYDAWLQHAAPDAEGNGSIQIDADTLPHGPLTVMLNAWNSPEGDPNFTKSTTSYLQLYNEGGVVWKQGLPAAPPQTAGMHVLFEDDFKGPLSISKTGEGTRYTSLKPDWPNGSEFGEAIFADKADAVNPFAILGDNHLRIRVTKAPEGYADPQGWNRKYIGGLLSSVGLDGTGIAATNGYFEARMQMPAGKGAWPAFWLMSQNSTGPDHLPSTAELDTVEAYGHDPSGACQAKHWWSGNPETHQTNCSSTNFAYGDNASTWHTYGTRITPTEVIYYIDNVEVWRHASFEQANTPMYFMINLALGGGWPIDLAKYGDQIDLYVDYVRVFEPDADVPPPSSGPTAPASIPATKVVGDTVVVVPAVSTNAHITTLAVSKDVWKQAQDSAAGSGIHKIVLEAPSSQSQEGVPTYELKLPADALSGGSPLSIALKTPHASVVLPSDMLKGQPLASSEVSIQIRRIDADTLRAETKQQIGNHPVIELTVLDGNKVISWNNPQAPVRVSIPYVPTAEELRNPEHIVVWYVDGAGNIHAVPNGRYDAEAEAVIFTTTHFSTYSAAYVHKTFEDVGASPAKQAIEVLASKGIINGTSDNRFSPDQTISRADFVVLLARILEWNGQQAGDSFSDVSANAYYSDALRTARALGIVLGSGNNKFNPAASITKVEMTTIAKRAWAASKLDAAALGDLFDELGNTPTRAETAELLYNLYGARS